MTGEPVNKDIEQLKTEMMGLKIRLKRIEDFLSAFPVPEEYLSKEELVDDELLEEAIRMVKRDRRVSASLFQRRFSIGYARAARLVDILEEKGIIGPAEGAKPREILID